MTPSPSDAGRRQRIERILSDAWARRARGETLTDAEIVACHPDLAPELAAALASPADVTIAVPASRPTQAAGAEPSSGSAGGAVDQTIIIPRTSTPSETVAPADLTIAVGSGSGRGGGEAPAVPGDLRTLIPGYDIHREISRGGQGVVYLATQQSTKRRVAIKLLLSGAGASPAVRKRFEREIELVAQLKHPNIISIFHSGLTRDGRQFYVMDYVDGVTLDRYVRDRQCTLEETIRLFLEVCDGVQYAHQRGMIHRDLKPGNVLVSEETESSGSRRVGDGTPALRAYPKILDFGLAKLLDGSTDAPVSMTDEVVGTLPYMSPEQATGRHDQVDTRTDVYALGVILYNLLTGEYPYRVVGSLMEVVQNITDTSPMPPIKRWQASENGLRRKLSKECPFDEDVQTIVLKALAKEPDRRYQSAGEFARDLRRYLEGEPIEARADSSWYVLRKTVRRYRAGLSAAAVFVALVCGTAIWMYFLYQEQSRLRKDAQEQKQAADLAKEAALAAKTEAEKAREKEAEARKRADEQRLEAERQAYLAGIGGADAALRAGDVAAARNRLDQTVEALRGWEWRHLSGLADRSTFTLDAGGPALDVAFSADGSRVAWGTEDGRIRVASIGSWQVERELTGSKAAVACVRFSPDGRYVAGGALDGELLLWGAERGERIARLAGHEAGVTRVAFQPEGALLASASRDGTVRVWGVPDGAAQATLTGHTGWVTALDFTSSGQRLLSGAWDNLVKVWDVPGRREALTYAGHAQRVNALAVSRYGDMAASASWGMIKVWTVSNGRELTTLQIAGGDVASVAISPDGTRVAAGSADGGLRLYDATTGFEIAVLRGHVDRVASVAFSPDFSWIATASADGTVKLWDANQAEKGSSPVTISGGVSAAAISPDGRTLAAAPAGTSGGATRIAIFDLTTGRRLAQFDAHAAVIDAVVFSPDGGRLATCGADRELKTWNIGSLRASEAGESAEAEAFDTQEALGLELALPGAPMHVAWSAGGAYLAAGLAGGEVVVVPVNSPDRPLTLTGHTDAVVAAAFALDENTLATGSWDGSVRTWSLPDGRGAAEFSGVGAKVTSLAFAGAGVLAVGNEVGQVMLWDSTTRRTVATTAVGRGTVVALTGGAAGAPLAAGMSTGRIALVDAASLTPLLTLRGHEMSLAELSFTPEARRLISISTDGVTRVWDAP